MRFNILKISISLCTPGLREIDDCIVGRQEILGLFENHGPPFLPLPHPLSDGQIGRVDLDASEFWGLRTSSRCDAGCDW
jgi:hypothetical protein